MKSHVWECGRFGLQRPTARTRPVRVGWMLTTRERADWGQSAPPVPGGQRGQTRGVSRSFRGIIKQAPFVPSSSRGLSPSRSSSRGLSPSRSPFVPHHNQAKRTALRNGGATVRNEVQLGGSGAVPCDVPCLIMMRNTKFSTIFSNRLRC